MLALLLSVLTVLPLKSRGLLCDDEMVVSDGPGIQSYVYDLPLRPFDDYYNMGRIKYNKPSGGNVHNLNLAYNMFGEFSGNTEDAVITAGYYAANNELIYSVEVNCGDQTWKSFAPNLEDPQTPELYQEGKLEKACVDGEDWDLIFKVKQAHQFTWMFNAESLQYGTQETKYKGKPRTRTLNVPSPDESPKGGAAQAVQLVIRTSGAAFINRVASGRCMAWPYGKTCEETKEWLADRSKARMEGYPGYLGLHNPHFTATCFGEVPTLFHPTQLLHPDAYSIPQSAWVCCVNMRSGQLFSSNKEKDCMELTEWKTRGEPFFCEYALNEVLIAQEMARLEQLG
ncbi:hypothetical protein ACHWQZ_G018701 [Mnemiopsis leidyi]